MLAVNDYEQIQRAHRDGMSTREMARRFHHSRHKIREILRGDESRLPTSLLLGHNWRQD